MTRRQWDDLEGGEQQLIYALMEEPRCYDTELWLPLPLATSRRRPFIVDNYDGDVNQCESRRIVVGLIKKGWLYDTGEISDQVVCCDDLGEMTRLKPTFAAHLAWTRQIRRQVREDMRRIDERHAAYLASQQICP